MKNETVAKKMVVDHVVATEAEGLEVIKTLCQP
jgi:hypothetical protein